MHKSLCLLALAMLALVGCRRTNLAAAENGGDPMPPAADVAALKGTWKLDASASSKDKTVDQAKAQRHRQHQGQYPAHVRVPEPKPEREAEAAAWSEAACPACLALTAMSRRRSPAGSAGLPGRDAAGGGRRPRAAAPAAHRRGGR